MCIVTRRLTIAIKGFLLFCIFSVCAESMPELFPNQPLILQGGSGSRQVFVYTPTPGSGFLKFEISGGSGDADIYVKLGSEPSSSNYDCRPYINGNNEVCTMNANATELYYIAIVGYRAFQNVSLVANTDQCGDCPPVETLLINGVPKTNLNAVRNGMLYYSMDVPSNATNLRFTISGGSGDADLYVKSGDFQNWPTTSDYDCRPYKSGNNETCIMGNANGRTYFVMIRAYTSFSGLQLVGTYEQ